MTVPVVFAIFLAGVANTRSLRAEVDVVQVQRSIDRGVAYLRKSQLESGGWREYSGQDGGLSSLCTLALLNAGVSRQDPDVLRALRYLRTRQPQQTYSLSLQTLVYCHVGAAVDVRRIRQNVVRLVKIQKSRGDRRTRGAWDYGDGRGTGDQSNSQFALLAIGAAADRGIEIDPEVFRLAREYWVANQAKEGGWGYRSLQATGSMTCAGIASLLIVRTHAPSSQAVDKAAESVDCCRGGEFNDDAIERAIDFLGKRFSVRGNPGSRADYFYYLYALERVGRLSGRRFIGGHDWYREGAERLLAIQDDFRGSWSGSGPRDSSRDLSTSFALLFLGKGKRQIVAATLETDRPGLQPYHQRSSAGLRQLVHFIERDWDRDLAWQSIVSRNAGLTDLLQSPVLVIPVDPKFKMAPELTQLLQQYVDQGGTLLFDSSSADGCGDADRALKSVRDLCAGWFPGAPLRRLSADHPVWFAEHRVEPATIAPDYWVYGVQACCRTAVFFSPQGLACRWRYGDLLRQRHTSDQAGAAEQADAAIRIGQNIIAYATGRQLKEKLQTRAVVGAGRPPEPGRGSLELSVLEIGAGADQVPRAAPNAAEWIRRLRPLSIRADQNTVPINAKTLETVPLLWIHGRTDFKLTPQQSALLRTFLRRQGTVIGSAICGSNDFTRAFRREIVPLLGGQLRTLESDHPVLSSRYGGFDLTSVAVRRPVNDGRSLDVRATRTIPVIQTVAADSRIQIFYSPLDLSCALESPNSIQCPGYSAEDAAKIMTNLVLCALNQ